MTSSAFDESSRMACGSTRQYGLISRSRSIAASSLGRPTSDCAVEHLALQVGLVDPVELDQPQPADAGGGEIERQRRAQPAGADQQHPRALEPLLALDPHLGDDQVAAVAAQLGRAQRTRRVRQRPHASSPSSAARKTTSSSTNWSPSSRQLRRSRTPSSPSPTIR